MLAADYFHATHAYHIYYRAATMNYFEFNSWRHDITECRRLLLSNSRKFTGHALKAASYEERDSTRHFSASASMTRTLTLQYLRVDMIIFKPRRSLLLGIHISLLFKSISMMQHLLLKR